MKQISIKEILDHLGSGVTRTKDGAGYDAEIGSIEEKYELSKAEVKDMFTHPLLRNKKTRPPKSFVLVDDVTKAEKETTSTAKKAPAYGAKRAGSPSTGEVEVELPTAASIEQDTASEEVIADAEPQEGQESLA